MGFLGFGSSGPSFGNANALQGQQQGAANTLLNTGANATDVYNQVAPGAATTTQNVANNLINTNPYSTAAGQQTLVAQALQGNAENTARAQSNADASNAERGMGDSGIAAGTNTAIQQSALTSADNASNNAAMEATNQGTQRQLEGVGLLNNLAGTSFGEGTGATAQAAGQFGSLSQQQLQEAIDAYNAQQASSQVTGGVLGNIFNAAASYAGV